MAHDAVVSLTLNHHVMLALLRAGPPGNHRDQLHSAAVCAAAHCHCDGLGRCERVSLGDSAECGNREKTKKQLCCAVAQLDWG